MQAFKINIHFQCPVLVRHHKTTSREGGERFSEVSPPFRAAKTMVSVNMTLIVLPSSVRARAEL